ncbi:MAG: phosphatidylinositol kinase [Acidobacteria bacterium]|nr:phosphatidylinositol kinase [Acidobacteriota bacterium]
MSAVQHVRPLRGGAQSHLLRASDDNWYVTKFQNNPQHIRVLANEMLATRLGLTLGLPMPRVEVIEVSDWLIENTEDLRIQLGGQRIPCRSGKQLGSLYVGSPGMTLDYLPQELLTRASNVADFARALVLDKWVCNADGRQAVYVRKKARSRRYSATFIDQGYCFNAGEWTFPDYPLRGVFANNCVYEDVTGWDAFEPALTRAEEMDSDIIWRCAVDIPEEWYEGDRDGLLRLVEALYHRRATIRQLISKFRESMRNPFPNWADSPTPIDWSAERRDEAVEIG